MGSYQNSSKKIIDLKESQPEEIIKDNQAEIVCESIDDIVKRDEISNPDLENKICKICQVPKKDLYKIESCGHEFCESCMSKYIQYKINEGFVKKMPCLDHACLKELKELEIENLISKDFFEKYLTFKNNEELNSNPYLRMCPQPNCLGYGIGNIFNPKITCGVCSYKYCYYCSEKWHSAHIWSMNDTCKTQREFEVWCFKNNVMFCPSCRVRIQKDKSKSCENMTCSRCGFIWCWSCGEEYVERHLEICSLAYDTGIYKNFVSPFECLLMTLNPFIFATLPLWTLIYQAYKTDIGMSKNLEFLFKYFKKRLYAYLVIIILGIIAIILTPIPLLIIFFRNYKEINSLVVGIIGFFIYVPLYFFACPFFFLVGVLSGICNIMIYLKFLDVGLKKNTKYRLDAYEDMFINLY